MAISLVSLSPREFSQLNFGEYINTASTHDEKKTLSVQSTLKAKGQSSFVLRFDEHRNAVDTSSPDDALAVYTVVRGDFRVYSAANIAAYVADIGALLSEANVVRILRGER